MSKNKYFNRDLSWLSFNERVLQEAEDRRNSINERLKFLAIFSSNLDEFFRVRVSKLREFKKLQKMSDVKVYEKPKKIIKQIQKRVDQLQIRFGKTFRDQLMTKLNEENVFLIDYKGFTKEQQKFSTQVYISEIHKHIKVYDLNQLDNFDFIKDKSLFFFVNTEQAPLIISIPTDSCKRFVDFPVLEDDMICITYIDEIIRDNVKMILPEANPDDLFSIKITRDGELYYDEEEAKLIENLKNSLEERKLGKPTRVLYDNSMPRSDLYVLRGVMNLKKSDVMPGGRYHNFSDFFQFPEIQTRLGSDTKPQLVHPIEQAESLFEYIQQKDALLSFPYQQYKPVIRLLEEASVNPDVTHIYITLYRVSKDSSVANGLLKCLKNGKQVTVFVEAKARFDEENNLEWGERLEHHGATVLYSMPDIKVHSKILLIQSVNTSVAYIGTGNFNEKSAKIYTDFALITANEEFTSDLKQVFNFLLDRTKTPELKQIWMSPFTTRQQLYHNIDKEIEIAKNGGQGMLMFKMNSLEDRAMIDKLYEAASQGVEIKLIVRGICCLNPDYSKANGNIKVISIVGKYLEHSRVYAFGHHGENGIYMGSADCMTRNLDKRVEVITPIYDKDCKETLLNCLSLQWNDNSKARIIDAKQTNKYQKTDGDLINAQEDFKTYLEEKS